ncbi:MAG: methyltransferase domain-containing protein [Acetobacteraceae bacterium]|nr:methyltransferase domain-containing protein [Acetobacteraceae bacterium]
MTDPTREGALELLSAVIEKRRPLEAALETLPAMDARDRAAGHRLAAAVLRRMGTLDAVIEPFLRRAPPAIVRHIIRIGAAGLLLLGTPAHAAVATSVALARRRGLQPFSGLVNAVLRRIAATGTDSLRDLDCVRLDTPPWLWASWGAEARAIADAHQQEPPLDITLAPNAAPPEAAVLLPTGSARLAPGTRITELPGFREGAFWVQDAAAALPACLLAPSAGEQVADLCAAPGGKTAQLASAGARVTAVERDPKRLDRVRENLARLNLRAALVQADAASWKPAAPFDAILLDAPCSATGIVRRHPDIPHLKRPRDIPALVQQQDRLLEAAASLLRAGGRLIYAVCSLQKEEGPERVIAAAARTGLRLDPFTVSEIGMLPEARTQEGWLRTHPGMWPERGGMDGFFAARLIRP